MFCWFRSRVRPENLGGFLTGSRASRLSLIGGVLALDFANTASGRATAQPIEHLQSAEDVVDWASHARSIDAATAKRCHAAVGRSAVAARKVLRNALELRDAVYRIGSAIARDEAPSRPDLGLLKTFACESIKSTELAPAPGSGYAFDFSASPVESALLGPVAWSAIARIIRDGGATWRSAATGRRLEGTASAMMAKGVHKAFRRRSISATSLLAT
jgi:Putative stress-induced transcription regulator